MADDIIRFNIPDTLFDEFDTQTLTDKPKPFVPQDAQDDSGKVKADTLTLSDVPETVGSDTESLIGGGIRNVLGGFNEVVLA